MGRGSHAKVVYRKRHLNKRLVAGLTGSEMALHYFSLGDSRFRKIDVDYARLKASKDLGNIIVAVYMQMALLDEKIREGVASRPIGLRQLSQNKQILSRLFEETNRSDETLYQYYHRMLGLIQTQEIKSRDMPADFNREFRYMVKLGLGLHCLELSVETDVAERATLMALFVKTYYESLSYRLSGDWPVEIPEGIEYEIAIQRLFESVCQKGKNDNWDLMFFTASQTTRTDVRNVKTSFWLEKYVNTLFPSWYSSLHSTWNAYRDNIISLFGRSTIVSDQLLMSSPYRLASLEALQEEVRHAGLHGLSVSRDWRVNYCRMMVCFLTKLNQTQGLPKSEQIRMMKPAADMIDLLSDIYESLNILGSASAGAGSASDDIENEATLDYLIQFVDAFFLGLALPIPPGKLAELERELSALSSALEDNKSLLYLMAHLYRDKRLKRDVAIKILTHEESKEIAEKESKRSTSRSTGSPASSTTLDSKVDETDDEEELTPVSKVISLADRIRDELIRDLSVNAIRDLPVLRERLAFMASLSGELARDRLVEPEKRANLNFVFAEWARKQLISVNCGAKIRDARQVKPDQIPTLIEKTQLAKALFAFSLRHYPLAQGVSSRAELHIRHQSVVNAKTQFEADLASYQYTREALMLEIAEKRERGLILPKKPSDTRELFQRFNEVVGYASSMLLAISPVVSYHRPTYRPKATPSSAVTRDCFNGEAANVFFSMRMHEVNAALKAKQDGYFVIG